MDDFSTLGSSGAGGWSDYFATAIGMAADQTPNGPNTVDTVPINAIQSMQPVSADQTQSFSGFWQDLTKGVLGYAIAKDAAKNGVAGPGNRPATNGHGTIYKKPAGISPLMLLLGAGGLAFVLTRGA